MKNTMSIFKESSQEFKRVSCLTACAMLISLSVILGYFSIQATESIRISFTFIPIAIVGYLYGPIVGGIAGGTVDLINFMIKPGGSFTPGITLCAILTGFVYGLFLYRKNIKVTTIALAVFCNTLFVDLLLKSYVLALLYHTSYVAYLGIRLPVQAIMLVLNTILLTILMNGLQRSGILKMFKR